MLAYAGSSLKSMVFNSDELFRTKERGAFPARVEALADLKNVEAEVDVIVCAHNLPELTNETIRNYLLLEKKLKIHVIVVESSGKQKVFDKLFHDDRVSRILLKTDVHVTGRVHGFGSYGMALSAAVGVKVSRAPYLFFSHSDMIATQEGFLSFLKSKLKDGVRLASFTQRHLIPFTGCMMVSRDLIDDPLLDWAPMDDNPWLKGARLEPLSSVVRHLNHVDCGEQYVYAELERGRPVYVCASRGGSKDWWHDPLDYYDASVAGIWDATRSSRAPIQFAELRLTREAFEEKHGALIKAGHEGFWLFERPKFWRYSFDDDGSLVFIHHGRGTTLHAVKRWIKYANRFQRDLIA